MQKISTKEFEQARNSALSEAALTFRTRGKSLQRAAVEALQVGEAIVIEHGLFRCSTRYRHDGSRGDCLLQRMVKNVKADTKTPTATRHLEANHTKDYGEDPTTGCGKLAVARYEDVTRETA
jgi:G:T-mismatch repair DNA endonuclease (very short patch repair protein)